MLALPAAVLMDGRSPGNELDYHPCPFLSTGLPVLLAPFLAVAFLLILLVCVSVVVGGWEPKGSI